MYEHNALGFWSGLALCLTRVRSSRARCPATALIFLLIKCEIPLHCIGLKFGVSYEWWGIYSSSLRGKCHKDRTITLNLFTVLRPFIHH